MYLVIDIETIVDKQLIKQVYDAAGELTIEQAYDLARDEVLKQSNQRSDFFPAAFHVPVCLGFLTADPDYQITAMGTWGEENHTEEQLLRKFWNLFEHSDTLITFNGRGFDLPVIEFRCLRHGIPAPKYFDDHDRFNNYRSARYAVNRHLDLNDFLGNFGAVPRKGTSNVIWKLARLPGKYEIEGADVEYLHRTGATRVIQQYCLTDVIQTYLLFLRLELVRGKCSPERYTAAIDAARAFLAGKADGMDGDNFLRDFLNRWDSVRGSDG